MPSRPSNLQGCRKHYCCPRFGCAAVLLLALLIVQHALQVAASDAPPTQSSGDSLLRKETRNLQDNDGFRPPKWLTPAIQSFIPWYAPTEYSLHPVDAFNRYTVCTDIAMQGCTESNVIRFTSNDNPGPTEFRYQDSGPSQLQGVFWTEMLFSGTVFSSTDLLSFARTRHGGGLATGVLETNEDGYEYVVRPVGDHNWSRSSNFPSFYLAYYDALYLFDLIQGTLEDPRAFSVYVSFKLFFGCLRFNFGRAAAYLIGRYDMTLITDPEHKIRKKYPGSHVWERKTSFFFNLISLTYHSIQIVDGNAQPLYPAYRAWQDTSSVNYFTGLRDDSLDKRLVC